MQVIEIAESVDGGFARSFPFRDVDHIVSQLAAALFVEIKIVVECPGATIERVEPFALVLFVKLRIDQLFHADILGISKLRRTVIGRSPDLQATILFELGGCEEFGCTFVDPARHGKGRGRNQKMVRVLVKQDRDRKIGLASAHVDFRNEGSRSAGAADVESGDVLGIFTGKLADLALAADDENGDAIGRAGFRIFPHLQQAHRRMVALERLGEFLHIFRPVVGVDDEVIGLRHVPIGLRRNRQTERKRKSQAETLHIDPPMSFVSGMTRDC